MEREGNSNIKRILDIVLSVIGLVIMSPVFLAIIALIKLDSRGPVLYRQTRIGKDGKPFKMLKFRTMMETVRWKGPLVSATNDPRVTDFGAVLRRLKLNEFPQLINVLKGDMSFVGPRPEVPPFVKMYGEEGRKVLSVRPGIVGPCQIKMRNEEELYPAGVDPKKYYVEHILPKKLKIDLEYVKNRTLLKDIGYLIQGVGITISGAITKRHIFENVEQITLFFCDMFLCGASYSLAYFLRMEGVLRPLDEQIIVDTVPYIVFGRLIVFTYFGLYSSFVRFFSFHELGKVVKGITVGSALIILLTFLLGERSHSRSVFIIDWFILVLFLCGYRLLFRRIRRRFGIKRKTGERNVMIYGAEDMGNLALQYLRMEGSGNVIAFIDDDPKKIKKQFKGLKILGGRYDIAALSQLYDVDEVLVAVRGIQPEDLDHIESLCRAANVKCEVFALAN